MSPLLRRGNAPSAPAGPPRTSLLLLVLEHAGRGHRLVELLRPHIDEVVVAAATKLSDRELELLGAAGPDALVRVPYDDRPQRALLALLELVSGEWAFWLRDDEVPSAALLHQLPGLLAGDAPALGYGVPSAWLWPDRSAVVDARPWWPDHRTRLLRTTPGLRHVPLSAGASPAVPGPVPLLDAPVLRLELLDRAAGDVIAAAVDDRPANPLGQAYADPSVLLSPPEDVATRPLEPEDAEVLARVLTPVDAPPEPLRGLPRTLPASELEQHWTRRRPSAPYEGELEVAERDRLLPASTVRGVLLRVTNRSRQVWPGLDRPELPVRASYRFLTTDGEVVVGDGMRTPLPVDVAPGESALVDVAVASPAPGEYVLELDLVHEFERWFGIAVTVPVTVC